MSEERSYVEAAARELLHALADSPGAVGVRYERSMVSLREALDGRERPVWYAAGGGIDRYGPFATMRRAWEAMRLIRPGASPYPTDARVWPEWAKPTEET